MNNELLSVVNYLERERGVSREIIIQAIESAILQVAKKNPDFSTDIEVSIDRRTLRVKASNRLIVSDQERGRDYISVSHARRYEKDAQEGDTIVVELPPSQLGRISAQMALQMIKQKIREAERKNVYDEYKDRIGEIVSGTVRQIIGRDVLIDIGKTEAIMPSKERLPTDDFYVGGTVRAYVQRVQSGANGPAVVLSRACNEFVKMLFRLEVSEIADGIVEVMAISRDPGYRTKIAVKTLDEKIDPVGACVGMRGARVSNIVRELNGEKIDIVRWSDDIRQYVTQALSPARLEGITISPDESRTILVTVAPDQLSLAIGKRGQNVRLSSRLTGWRINIRKSGVEVSFEEQREYAEKQLAEELGIDAEAAAVLVANGFLTVDGIVAVELAYLREITELDEDVVVKIWETAHKVTQI